MSYPTDWFECLNISVLSFGSVPKITFALPLMIGGLMYRDWIYFDWTVTGKSICRVLAWAILSINVHFVSSEELSPRSKAKLLWTWTIVWCGIGCWEGLMQHRFGGGAEGLRLDVSDMGRFVVLGRFVWQMIVWKKSSIVTEISWLWWLAPGNTTYLTTSTVHA